MISIDSTYSSKNAFNVSYLPCTRFISTMNAPNINVYAREHAQVERIIG